MVPILMYHEVNTDDISHPDSVNIAQFEAQMRYLSENGFRTLLLDELLAYNCSVNSQTKDLRPILITFDDGHIGNYKYAFPILRKNNLSAVFFITVQWVINRKNMVSWDQLKEMYDGGMSIQSHTITHIPLSTMTDAQISYELSKSKKFIEANIGNKVEFLSLPHGDFDKRIGPLAKDIGYKAIFTSDQKYFRTAKNLFFIGRIPLKRFHAYDYFVSIVENKCRYFIFKSFIHKTKFFIRSAIGINNFRRLYRFINKIEVNN